MSLASIYRKATTTSRGGYLLRQAARTGYEVCLRVGMELSPSARRERQALLQRRTRLDDLLNRIGRDSEARFDGTVLVDGTWDNPNHWLRYSLFRAALGLAHGAEIGLTGQFRAVESRSTLRWLGIGNIASFPGIETDRADFRRRAKRLLAETAAAEDILEWRLPHDLPAVIVYDGILKRQRGATVDLRHPAIEDHVAAALGAIERAERLLERTKPDLVALSHSVGFDCGALAWLAIKCGIPGAVLYGEYGLSRFWKLQRPADVFMTANFPTLQNLSVLTDEQGVALRRAGRDYLEKRRAAQTMDVGAIHAFQRGVTGVSREDICRKFSWDPRKKIVAVYSVSWFDYPHLYGDMNFLDSLDWMRTTIAVALEADNVNWLFRPHPLEAWYGGVSLDELMPRRLPGHIGVAQAGWNGVDVMNAVDALITLYGTAGIEFAGMGKPVVTASKGWYHNLEFTKTPNSRGEYREFLRSAWWEGFSSARTIASAQAFAGWHFCCPEWQEDLVMGDDFEQDGLYNIIPDLIERNRDGIATEIHTIADWWKSDSTGYHSYKMARARGYSLSNVR